MSANPNYRKVIAHGGFKAACKYARTALRLTNRVKLSALQRERAQNSGYQKFVKLMEDTKNEAKAAQKSNRTEIDIYKKQSASATDGSLDEGEEAVAAAELKRMLQARLDAENQTQVQMLRDERARRKRATRRKERLQFQVEFQKFDEDGSGGIDPMELPHILDKLIRLGAGGVPHEVVNDVILSCDADGDGTLDFDEFCEILWTLKRDYTPPKPELTDAELIQVCNDCTDRARRAESA